MCFCCCLKICYILIQCVLSMYLSWYTFGDNRKSENDSATGSMYLGDTVVGRNHRIICDIHSIFRSSWSHTHLLSFHRPTKVVWFLTHSCQAFIDECNSYCSLSPGIPACPLTLFRCYTSPNCCFSTNASACHARLGAIFIIGCLPCNDSTSLDDPSLR
jgi:hypothetical protein